MITRLYSATVIGVEGVEVEVEIDLKPAAEKRTFIVGLPDTAIKESTHRVESAISNSDLPEGQGIFVVNLAPADIKKQGPSFDLAIALGIVACTISQPIDAKDWSIIGELALDGSVRAVQGILPQIIAAREQGKRYMMVPSANAQEASVVHGIDIYPVDTLKEAWLLLTRDGLPTPYVTHEYSEAPNEFHIDFDEIKGQAYARRAMEIAAAGHHNILLSGSPGSGKSMLAQRIPTILPTLRDNEALETSKIHSVCGLLSRESGLMRQRPFRAPHHTISDVGLMGGGSTITPGEISLAHHGVLFLDELPEFKRATLETLRQPIESGQIIISRASGTMTFPSRFMLAAAMNPCPCGYLGDARRRCSCSPSQIARYKQKISGPLLDRFDLMMEVPAVDPKLLTTAPTGESSAKIRERVEQARNIQTQRYEGTTIKYNAMLSGKSLKQFCPLSTSCQEIISHAVDQLSLSARAFDRIIKVARTIADLASEVDILEHHLYEAIQYRSFETKLRT